MLRRRSFLSESPILPAGTYAVGITADSFSSDQDARVYAGVDCADALAHQVAGSVPGCYTVHLASHGYILVVLQPDDEISNYEIQVTAGACP